jgi:transposase-like protein
MSTFKPSPPGTTLIELMELYGTPDKARAYLESVRWPDGPICPHCGVVREATRLSGKAGARGLFKCNACKEQFTVTVGTVMEDSHIPLHKWVIAIHLMCANKKAVSALSLQRMLKLGSYRTAWHMCHRIRESMRDTSTDPIGGTGKTVEVDETYIGGKVKNMHKAKRIGAKPGPADKTPVVALVERNGKVRSRAVTNVDVDTISPILRDKMAKGSILMTDSAMVYGFHFKDNLADIADHRIVNHSAGEYVRVDPDGYTAHTQTVESYNGLVKRCIMGAWHNVSDRHLDRYLDEINFRWNTRRDSDGERMEQAIRQTEGRRLPLRPLKTDAGRREASDVC